MATEAGNRYRATGPVVPRAIPATLHDSLLARLDRLGPTRELAQFGAALGRHFSHELISAVAEMPQNQVDDAMVQLEHAELIFRRGVPPDAEYTFKHALVQDAAYSTMLRSRRQQLHGRIAAILEGEFPELGRTQPEFLAHHCAEAGLSEKAIDYYLAASKRATAASNNAEASRQMARARTLLDTLPASARRATELRLKIEVGGW
ncbi:MULTISPECIES: hypothetical protein [Bradyrhizobium]|uniref:hypothetical protein n=1 Tax=Bradyrhizobium TaxID=374 RepID=UPI0012FE3945|nr:MULTISPECIES: hypothetical protein [Bradyrhizobium]MCP1975477.1 putative ATPase [Bradyrhizobium elkanii]MCS3482241.1 putative ATPase [Bradyrhizobium elkanii]MCS3525074.1 putative ATPase [Bradyrhizobium elkanii]MCS4075714.1 putative ATPase [Bradyrhizobium elkanii]MCS4085037.1 putative ATPase [Bradyrhizobium elkanii]